MCYAEFAARVPLAGSAYTYTYVTIGEMCAFVIGWNLILEYVIGNASVARTFTGYLNHLTGDHIIPYLSTHLRMNISSLAPYLDVFAFAIVMTMTMLLVVGVKESATLTKMFTMLNLLVLSFVAVCGLFTEQWSNWSIDATQVPNASKCAQIGDVLEQHKQCCARPDGCGEGGFTPYGFSGVVAGAATCFFAFVGFDVIATTGEEARNPSKTIPLAILVSLGICCFFYMATSTTLTLMTPYFEIDSDAPFVVVFDKIGWTVSAFLVSIGAVCALSTSLLGSMFSMPRVVLAMARDGLLFECFAYISPSLKTPVVATLCSGLFAGTMAALFDVGSLVEMMSIGTLMAYTVVAASVLMLR
uniref:Uncharacterized protein n=1 Tax=Plectus sambesii TaxID=2011161 RepID=A0A914UJE3_9BILA